MSEIEKRNLTFKQALRLRFRGNPVEQKEGMGQLQKGQEGRLKAVEGFDNTPPDEIAGMVDKIAGVKRHDPSNTT